MKQNLSFSIIIPVFNAAPYLETCLESILQQEYKRWELILIDDGSTDDSLKILQQYAKNDGRIKVIHQNNKGQGAARNKGMEIMTGDFVLFVDADDAIAPSTLSGNIDYLTEHSDIDFLQFPVYKNYGTEQASIRQQEFVTYYSTDDYICLFLQQNIISWIVCDKIFKQSFIGRWRFRTDIKFEDNYFMMQLLPVLTTVCISNKGLYYYYQRENSTTTSKITYLKEFGTYEVLVLTLNMLAKNNKYNALFYKYLVRLINVNKSLNTNFKVSMKDFKAFKPQVRLRHLMTAGLSGKDTIKALMYKYMPSSPHSVKKSNIHQP